MKSFAGILKSGFFVAAVFAAPFAASAAELKAPSGTYALDQNHGNVVFQVTHLGLSPFTARFDKFDATLTLNVEDPSKSAVTASIDVGSYSTNVKDGGAFDKKVAFDKKFLNGKEFPKITFKSKKVRQTSDTTATITGDLTLLGVTQEISLDAQLTGSVAAQPFMGGKPAIGFTASGVFDRTAWGFKHLANTMPPIDPAPIVSPEVSISIQAEFVKTD